MVRIVGKVVSERDYPRLARDRGWQGSTMVRVEIGTDGLLRAVAVTRSSGFSVLDDRAVSKIREIKLPNIPDELRERAFSVDVPFRFSLRKGEQ
jgi:protein TonB